MSPKSVRVTGTDPVSLPVHGQGVFLFSAGPANTMFTIYTADKSDGLEVFVTATAFRVRRLANSDTYVSQDGSGGLTPASGAYYWFSLDSQNQVFLAGVGEPRPETACYVYRFDPTDRLWEANKEFLERLVTIELPEDIKALRILRDPVTRPIPMLVRGMNDLTMEDVAANRYVPSSAMSAAAQALYGCVAGERFVLNTPDFPDFSDAIEYSIRTAGCWCNTRLKQKATEFGPTPQPLETYLRITLGQNNGESPGVPYVMEIWPVGHYSPVHNHSGAHAIIRVLHGTIHVKLFPFLCTDAVGVKPFAEKDFVKDDITWISPCLNQVHQLKNLETSIETCITIQCYLYDADDAKHYDYFDYLGDGNAKSQYEPDSDMDFLAFKETMRKEWAARPRAPARRGLKALGAWFRGGH